MRIRPFDYFDAISINDALEKLEHYGAEIKLLAGGTDLVLAMKEKKILPPKVMSLHKIRELDFVREENGAVRIGALSRHADLEVNTTLKTRFPILCEAVGSIGSWQIRNVATIGGNLCTASPAADSAPALLALDARMVIVDTEGEREVPAVSFFTGPGETMLKPNQMLKEIIIGHPKTRSAGCYLKLTRKRALDLALVGVAFHVEVDEEDDKLTRVAIALGGVAPTPIRAPKAEALLTGLSYDKALKEIPNAAQAAVEATRPISDIRASADYRKAIVKAYTRRAAQKILDTLFKGEGIQR